MKERKAFRKLPPQLSIRLARFKGLIDLGGFMDNRNYWGNGFDLSRRGESLFLPRRGD